MKPATCHPDKPVAARGLCITCYQRERRAKIAAEHPAPPVEPDVPLSVVVQAAPLVDILERTSSIEEAIELASRELQLAVPEAARAIRRIIRESHRDAVVLKAAEAVLRGVAVSQGAKSKRLLEAPQRASDGPQQAQVVIGLHVSGDSVRLGTVVGTVEGSGVQKHSPVKGRG